VTVVVPGIWVFRGVCRRADDPELFFPHGTDMLALRQVQRAKAFCARCPVRDECLSYALASQQRHGIWGGTTAEERRDLDRIRHHDTMQG
jgi:WhiB family redox-sensing transcriptional regulator